MSTAPLRIHVITSEDPFYIPVFFREFLARFPKDHMVLTGIDITPPLNQKTSRGLAAKLYDFYGAVDFARLGLRYAASRAKQMVLPRSVWDGTVPRLAARHGVPCRVVPAVNDPSYVQRLRGLGLDLLVSVAASQIFKADLLSVPRRDAINIHTGTLPHYRGMLPVFWQLLDGRSTIGVTVHTMTTDIDLGEILLHREVPVTADATLDQVIKDMKREGATTMLQVLERYHDGTITRHAMDRSQEGYRSFPRRADGVAFKRRGRALL